MTDELEVIDAEVVALGTIQATSPSDVIKRASAIATELAKIVDEKNLFSLIKGKKHVRVEGWNTLGAMLGVLPRERSVTQIENGYEAYVELLRTSDGEIVGGASSICTRDENTWSTRDEYAVRSMAVTRATGKAFRLGFSWIVALAGYEATPAEEMPHTSQAQGSGKSKAVPHPDAKKSKAVTDKPSGPVGVLLDLGVDNAFHAAAIATLLKFTSETSKDEIKAKYTNYRALRDEGKDEAKAAAMVLS